MTTTKELREKRAGIWAQAQEFDTRKKAGDTLSAEDEAAWTRALDEVDSIGADIDRLERTAALDSKFGEIDHAQRDAANRHERSADAGPDAYRQAFTSWMRNGMTGLSAEERQLLEAEYRAQSVGTTTAGGYTAPTGFWAKVTETLKLYTGAATGAEMITTSDGTSLPWPTNDDTSNVGEQLGENTAAAEQDFTFGQKSLGAYTYSSKMVKVSLQLLQDTGIDLESFLARKLGERIGRIENTRLTTGTGSSQPLGYVAGFSTGKTTASATAITYNELIDLIHSVDAAYRASGRCRWKMHDLVLAYVRKIRDDSGGAGLGRPIWEPSVQVGVPDLLLGHPYDINNDMASTIATTNKTMAFGDFQSAFVVRKVSGGQMMQLRERYAEALQVAFLGFERMDATVQDTSAAKLLVQA